MCIFVSKCSVVSDSLTISFETSVNTWYINWFPGLVGICLQTFPSRVSMTLCVCVCVCVCGWVGGGEGGGAHARARTYVRLDI